MGVATAISLGLAVAGGVKQAIDSSNAKAAADNAAEQEANKLARINEADKFKSLQVPTLGLELAQQNIQARQAQDLQALREAGGAAGVLGGLTAVNQQGRAEDLALSEQAQNMQYQRDMAQAQNAQRIEQNRAEREAALAQSRLAGAQAFGAQARNAEQAAYTGLAENAMNAAFAHEYFKNNKDGATGLSTGQQVPEGTPQVNPNSKGITPNVAQQSYNPPANTIGLNTQNNVSGWQSGVYAPQVTTMPGANVDLSGLRAAQGDYEKWLTLGGQTGDPLNDMYHRKALLGY